MDNLHDSENNAKISDSGYSNSCSNSQSRRSRSSKSTYSGSHSSGSGSSGYGEGKPSASAHSPKLSGLAQQHLPKKPPSEPTVLDGDDETKVGTTIFEAPPEEPVKDCPTIVKECAATSPVPEVKEIPDTERNNLTSNGEVMMAFNNVCPLPNQMIQMKQISPVQKTVTSHSTVGFSCVISMHDGIVMYTTSTITTSLGFPKEMWLGRSFIDFIHPKDRDTFAAQITNGLAVPKNSNDTTKKACPENSCVATMVSRIRRYRGITTGYGVKENSVAYIPFQLKLSFKNVDDDEGHIIYLVIQATPFITAYKIPNEPVNKTTPFIIRHSATGILEYLDPESVPYLGYLPQDMLNKDALRLYHHEDLPYLRQVYKTIVKEGGMPRCKSFRIQVQNGDYITVETEWHSFINPWTRKLEFIIGKHFIIEGPTNVDVFETPDFDKINFLCEEEEKEKQAERNNLIIIMNEVLTKPAEIAKQQMTKRCQDLASFIENLIDDTAKSNSELKVEVQDTDQSYYERDSVMLGGLSPHREYNDSKSSSGTPISYNQLNYNENLQRYFESDRLSDEEFPKLAIESTVTNHAIVPETSNSSNKIAMESADKNKLENVSPSKDSSFLSVCSHKTSSTDFKPLRLTESLMSKHNAEMEKELYKKHRELRSSSKGDRTKSNDNYQKKMEHLARCNASYQPTTAVLLTTPEPQSHHGLKRTQKMNMTEVPSPKYLCTSQNRRLCISSSPNHSTSNAITPSFLYGGQAVLYSPVSHPLQSISSSSSPFDTMNTLGLGNSNYEEATSSKNFWSHKKGQENKIAVSKEGSTSNSSNNTGRRSHDAISRNFHNKTDGESTYSSFRSSFFKTESGSADDSDPKKDFASDNKAKLDSTHGYFDSHAPKTTHKRKMDAPWMEQVCVTPNLMLKYQIKPKNREEVLKADKMKIQNLEQPALVNEQLGQLYLDLQLEGVASRLTLEEGITSSSSSGEESPAKTPKKNRTKREYSVMIYEEDAPLPSPTEFKEPIPGPSKRF